MNEVAPLSVFVGLDPDKQFDGLREALAPVVAAICKRERGHVRRTAVVELFRSALAEGREIARERLEARGSGLACARLLSALEDELIGAIYDYVVRYVYVVDNPTFAERLVIVAVGGYGRGTLAPGSDIDLLFLVPYKQTPWGESVIEAILLYSLGSAAEGRPCHAPVAECMPGPRRHDHSNDASRGAFHLGNAELFSEFRESFDREIVVRIRANCLRQAR
jgi:[protein-PII] uridylyltransferase